MLTVGKALGYYRGTGLQPDVGLMGKIHRQMLTHFTITQILASSLNGIGGCTREIGFALYPMLCRHYRARTFNLITNTSSLTLHHYNLSKYVALVLI